MHLCGYEPFYVAVRKIAILTILEYNMCTKREGVLRVKMVLIWDSNFYRLCLVVYSSSTGGRKKEREKRMPARRVNVCVYNPSTQIKLTAKFRLLEFRQVWELRIAEAKLVVMVAAAM